MNEPLTRRIGWIGTGVMGRSMAEHLIRAGHHLRIHTRTKERAASLLALGATWAETPAEAADAMEIVFSIVGGPADVTATHLGEEGTLRAPTAPAVIVDMTTSEPSLAQALYAEARDRGIGSVDAPVSGGDVGARNATLSIMAGGDEHDVGRIQPLLAVLGDRIVHQGGPGAGQHAKMVNQILIATNMIGICEGLLYAHRAGLDPLRVIESVGSGAAGSWSINNLGPRIVQRDFEPGFSVGHFLKDLDIALNESARMGLAMPGLALARQLYEAVRAHDGEHRGTQALILALERLNGIDR